jgi:hypothetical protein
MPRLFQNFDIYPGYLAHLHRLAGRGAGYAHIHDVFHDDRFVAVHMLKPTLERSSEAAFALGRDSKSQSDWAHSRGMASKASAEEILLAQIEEHKTEVFYNHDPLAFGSAFIRKLPGCVRTSIAWRAAPSPGADFGAYDAIVCNFPAILESYAAQGWRSAYFYPAHDPVMDDYNRGQERPTDLLFIGTYSRHHRRRAQIIERIAELSGTAAVRLHLYLSPMTRVSETPIGLFGPLRRHRRPKAVRRAARGPLFGRELYSAMGSARIVINGAIDMAALDRGNMRCWEALGCGALMVSDEGLYPAGMEDSKTIVTYGGVKDLMEKVRSLLADESLRHSIAAAGNAMVRTRYSKERQWQDFLKLL